MKHFPFSRKKRPQSFICLSDEVLGLSLFCRIENTAALYLPEHRITVRTGQHNGFPRLFSDYISEINTMERKAAFLFGKRIFGAEFIRMVENYHKFPKNRVYLLETDFMVPF